MRTTCQIVSVFSLMMTGCSEAPRSDDMAGAALEENQTAIGTSEEPLVDGVKFQFITANGIRMRIATTGDEGPLVLFAHGWPESWYSWRHQFQALGKAGYRVVAPDMRGYGETDAPQAVDAYDAVHLAADMVGVLDAMGEDKATIVGHDWGSIVAAYSVLMYPERFSSLVLMSVPYGGRSPQAPMPAMQANNGDNFFYILYHNEPHGVAEAEYDANPRALLSRLYLSQDSPREVPEVTDPKRSAGGWIPRLGAAKGLPSWLSQEDLDYFVSQFEHSGFRGGVNYYRNFQRNWEITAHLTGEMIEVPTLFIAGERDGVINDATVTMLEDRMAGAIRDLRGVVLLPGIGHWVQQEAPEATNEAILTFLEGL